MSLAAKAGVAVVGAVTAFLAAKALQKAAKARSKRATRTKVNGAIYDYVIVGAGSAGAVIAARSVSMSVCM